MLTVRDPFHLDGVLKVRGDILTDAEADQIKDDDEKMRRCLKTDDDAPVTKSARSK